MRWIVTALAVAAWACPAAAGSYDDFSAGVDAGMRGDHDAAIASYTAALKPGDLAAPYVPAAYRMRSMAYLSKTMCREALADLDAAAHLTALDRSDLLQRYFIKRCLGDLVGAKQDAEGAMGPVPDPLIYGMVGRAQWEKGAYAEAAESYAQAVEFSTPRDAEHGAYTILWYAVTAARAGKSDPARLTAFADTFDVTGWPRPLIDLFRGSRKAEDVHPVVAQDDKEFAGQSCEVDFYVGEWQLAQGHLDVAKPLIARAAAQCPKNFIEYGAAKVEQGRIDAAGGLP